jgi:vancomycin resistance protein YoaR
MIGALAATGMATMQSGIVAASARAIAATSQKVVLVDGERCIVRRPGDLGIRQAAAAGTAATADLPTLKRALTQLAAKFAQAPDDARPYIFQGAVHIRTEQTGRVLDVPATAGAITKALSEHPHQTTFTVVETERPAKRTAHALTGITGVLASFQTKTSASFKRNHNVAVAVQRIDGTVLAPGDTFSLNRTVGKRTHATGFLTAHVFVDAKVVDGVGGGVSQVTGTLFNAAALAGLRIDEVHPHSRPVAYLPLGRDATVAYGDEDLRFTNDTKAPVFIAYQFEKRDLRATIFGAPVPGRVVQLRPRVHQLGPGQINAQLYRVTKEHGKIVNREKIFTHAYRWDPKAPSA